MKRYKKGCKCSHHKDGWINHFFDCPNEDQYDIWMESHV